MSEYSPEQKRIDYRYVFATESGRRIFDDLMVFCKFLNPVHVSGDPIETAINEGKRNTFLYIMAQVSPVREDQAEKIRKEILNYG
jgi:hypothetical protein